MSPKPSIPSDKYGMSTFEVRSLCEYVDVFVSYPLGKFFARGEPREYDQPWLPTIWRDDHAFKDTTPVIGSDGYYTTGEFEALKECQTDFLSGKIKDSYFEAFFKDAEANISIESVDLLHWTALAQHYGEGLKYPTRLLDVTTDAFIALYFAVSCAEDDDGFVKWSRLNDAANDMSHLPNMTTAGSFLDIRKVEASDGGTDYIHNDETLTFMRPPRPNQRTEAQRGAFIWALGPEQNYLRTGFAIRIPADAKASLLTELSRMNYDHERLFPI